MERAALIGAFERHNFGDHLFLLLTETYLRDHGIEVLPAGPFEAQGDEAAGRSVVSYDELLRATVLDQVWTVGGEVGGVTVGVAARMGSEGMSRPVSQLRDEEPAYLVRPSAFPANIGIGAAINSSGLSGLAAVSGSARELQLAALAEADWVAVRDRRSHEFLRVNGVPHVLAPDMVHTLALSHAGIGRDAAGDTVLFQASERWLLAVGLSSVAGAIAEAPALRQRPVRLIVAGSARGHDSFGAYEQLVRMIRQKAPTRDVDVLHPSKDPWQVVDAIAHSGLWIGQSLHGRIVSAAFGVPRVSLVDPKLDCYAETWDEGMPFGVTARTLASAVDAALAATRRDREALTGVKLGELADRSLLAGLAALQEGSREERILRRVELLEQLRARQVAGREASLAWRLARAGHHGRDGALAAGRREVRRVALRLGLR